VPHASLGEELKNWRLLAENLRLRIEDVSFLDSLLTQSGMHEGRLREANRQRAIAEERTAELYGRMVFVLKGLEYHRAQALDVKAELDALMKEATASAAQPAGGVRLRQRHARPLRLQPAAAAPPARADGQPGAGDHRQAGRGLTRGDDRRNERR
jgi:hypothetical protein